MDTSPPLCSLRYRAKQTLTNQFVLIVSDPLSCPSVKSKTVHVCFVLPVLASFVLGRAEEATGSSKFTVRRLVFERGWGVSTNETEST